MADIFRVNTDWLAVGQMIAVDCAAFKGKCSVYTIEKGDTLVSIAGAFGVDMKVIVALNNIPNPNRIAIGQKILVPGVKK